MNPILEQFLVEARENLLYLDKNLENLEDGDSEVINALFRSAHTLKGSSGLAGLDAVKETTHIAEDLLDAYRNDKIQFSKELLDALYDMFDEVTELIDVTEESGEIPSINNESLNIFKSLRSNILNIQEQENVGIDTELIIIDDEVPPFASFFKNDFDDIDILSLPLESKELTQEKFEQMNYYIIDIDLSNDTLELGNDPFYSMFLLESENIISMYTKVSDTKENIKENPLNWVTRIVAIVHINQELLKDAFYNFLEEVTIYPLSLKALLYSDLEAQSNDSIIDFIEDLKVDIQKEDYSNLTNSLKAVQAILNPSSLQGFLFTRVLYLLEQNDLDNTTITNILNYILILIDVQSFENDKIEQESILETEAVEQESILEPEIVEQEYALEPEVKDTVLNNCNTDLDEKETKILIEILIQQKHILNIVKSDNVLIQVKSILSKLQENLGQDFNLNSCNDKLSLENIINSLLNSLGVNYEEESVEEKSTEEPIKSTEVSTYNIDENVKPRKEQKAAKPLAKTVKIDLQDIDSMMDIVGEMLVIKNALPYIADELSVKNVDTCKRDLLTRYDEINRVSTALQEKVMEMRLLSLSFIFDRYPKLIRDISKTLDKKIKYNEEGGDTKLDKTIIEKLADPLIHIIRNSLDHGIETPEQRESSGKNPEGTITISAKSIGDKVYVSIEDDGKGIDVNKVVHKSLEKEMVNPDELDAMTHDEKLLLVFHPGVSTMDQISDLSGRGVGMDVVRQTIDDIGGKISLKSEVGIGTKITLELPMSVALSNVFHVKLGINNYAVSMDSISETVQVLKEDIEWVNKKPMLKLRGELIPLNFYYNLLSKNINLKDTYSLVIIETDGSKFGLIVDEFVNQLDIIQKPLSENFQNHPFISGTSLLGNGEVLFVMNPAKLINLKEKK
ncbi:MAG: chemotaxis protein CheA [Campylobacterota bacterium]|nr:chemotaxis protein CheA [Campylobacterota bacterium]